MPMSNSARQGAPLYMSKQIGMRVARYVEAPEGAPTPAPTPPAPADPPAGDEPLGDSGKKALETERAASKEWERRAKEAEAKVEAAESAKLSDIDRANKERDDAKSEAATARAELAVLRLAAANGITEQDDIDLLIGVSDETQRAALAARLASKPTPKPAPVPKAGTGNPDSGTGSGSIQAGRDLHASLRK